MPPPELDHLLARVRQLSAGYRTGRDPGAIDAFQELVSLLLGITVLHRSAAVRRHDAGGLPVLAGWELESPLRLTNDCFLRMYVSLFIEQTPDAPRLKVKQAYYQYQLDEAGNRWVFRYEYLRDPASRHPPGHLHIRGNLLEAGCLPAGRPLERVHFPAARFSLEAVIRLLAEHFEVPCNRPPEVWHPVLALSEGLFLEIAHRYISGPGG